MVLFYHFKDIFPDSRYRSFVKKHLTCRHVGIIPETI